MDGTRQVKIQNEKPLKFIIFLSWKDVKILILKNSLGKLILDKFLNL